MGRVTDFECVDDTGHRILCDAFGNNVAFKCPNCAHPVLSIVRRANAALALTILPFVAGAGMSTG